MSLTEKQYLSHLTIICRRRSELVLPNNPRDEVEEVIRQYSEENNCFSIIAHAIIRATAFSFSFFFLLVSSSKTSRNRVVTILKISASVL